MKCESCRSLHSGLFWILGETARALSPSSSGWVTEALHMCSVSARDDTCSVSLSSMSDTKHSNRKPSVTNKRSNAEERQVVDSSKVKQCKEDGIRADWMEKLG